MVNSLTEIIESLQRHPVRIMVTASGVSWSVFILIVLLGIGRGIETGMLSQLKQYSRNTLWFLGGIKANLDFEGDQSQVKFDSSHLSLIQKRFPDVLGLTPEFQPTMMTIKHYEYSGPHLLKGVSPDYFPMKSLTLDQGRLLNFLDGLNQELVLVLGKEVKKVIFGAESAVGQYINLSGYHCQVVGVLNSGSLSNQYEANTIFISHQTLISYFNHGATFNKMGVWLPDHASHLVIGDQIEELLLRILGLINGSNKELYTFSTAEQAQAFHRVFRSIRYFIWMIGVSLIVGSIVGLSNTMLMSVNTRMEEIAVRKAFGATPTSIAGLVVGETVLIVLSAGLLGIMAGLVLNKLLAFGLNQLHREGFESFTNFQVSPEAVGLSLFLLIVSGTLAGLIPAMKAARLKPAQVLIGR